MTHHLENPRELHVSRWRASGLSRAAYCRKHDIAYHVFISWIKQSSVVAQDQNQERSTFIEVLRPLANSIERPSLPVASVTLPSGIMMRVLVGTDAVWIGQVVAAVRSC